MKNNKVKIVEYIKKTFMSYMVFSSTGAFYKSSLVGFVVRMVSFLFRFFISLLHAEDDSCVKKKNFIVRKKKCEDLEVLYKEGLIDVYNIASYVRSHFGKDTLMLISKNNKHSKYHIDHLFTFLKKIYYSRTTPCPIIIKGSCCSFKLVVNPFYRSSTKYLQISNIVKRSVSFDKPSKFDKKESSYSSSNREQFFFSKNLNLIDKITTHNKKDVKSSLESLNTFLTYYGDHIYSKNVSWYSNANSNEYKVMVLTDIVSSTKLWCDSYEEMSMAITQHDYIALELVDKYRGTISRNEGDSFFIFFDSVNDATKFSLMFRKQIQQIKVLGKNLGIKIAIHAGVVKMSAGGNLDAYGQPVEEISEMLSQSSTNKICIKKEILSKASLSTHSPFCVH